MEYATRLCPEAAAEPSSIARWPNSGGKSAASAAPASLRDEARCGDSTVLADSRVCKSLLSKYLRADRAEHRPRPPRLDLLPPTLPRQVR